MKSNKLVTSVIVISLGFSSSLFADIFIQENNTQIAEQIQQPQLIHLEVAKKPQVEQLFTEFKQDLSNSINTQIQTTLSNLADTVKTIL